MNAYYRIISVSLLILAWAVSQAAGDPRPVVGVWDFDRTLVDLSGRGNDAFAPSTSFVAGHSGQGLQCNGVAAIVPDSPELRPAPGLRLNCWVKLDALGTTYQPIVIKDRAFQLRLDPPTEGSHFSFFLNAGGWEPRVSSRKKAQIGVWYHLSAGWDGKEIWLDVDGERSSRARAGDPTPSGEPLQLGLFAGVLDALRIENPAAPPSGVAQWLFDGDLRDATRHGHHLTGQGVEFAPVPGGKALKSSAQSVKAASDPSLQLAPGFRIDCSVYFEQVPDQSRMIAIKNNEYQLRLESQKEGGVFAFFVNLDGWEPRVRSDERIVAGKWYRITAAWDGAALTLDVNGQRTRTTRRGLAKPTDNPLVVGPLGGLIDNLKIENRRLPLPLVRDARQEHAILVAGRIEKFTTIVRNVGMPSAKVSVRLKLPKDVRAQGPAAFDLGAMEAGAEKTIQWSVIADAPLIGSAEFEVLAAGAPPVSARHPLVFFSNEGALPPSASEKLADSRQENARTYYIDSVAGDNANPGLSPDAPWKDFSNINGKTLAPGERLLLKRGSVFNQELSVSARGQKDRWAEIGAYGQGARPIIRRNWDIDDRCALIKNPDYLRIRSLVVSHAAKGMIVHYTEPGHRGLVIEDCIAHHIEGLYRFNAHGIPEWLDKRGPSGDGLHHSAGIGVSGVFASDLILRDCEMFQCSSGYFMRGHDVIVERVFCHDNIVHNTSPHPFLVDVRRAMLRNSIFDASGWHASAGTMGIMLGDIHGLIIRNCYFRNQPDSGSHDEGGIDFENRGNGCLIDRCTFENNAGAAIEVLGLKTPQTTNIEIRDSKFILNNTAKKLGPSEIFVWGRVRDPSICCSTGLVQGNGYVLLTGIEFFINEAPKLTSWTLNNNTQYASAAEIDKAMPFNRPPSVEAGPDIRTDRRQVALAGNVRDDGLPAGKALSTTWELLDGPGTVTFDNAGDPATSARFEKEGDYILRLVARDGELWLSDTVVVHILPAGTSVLAAWEFNRNLDKEGWTEANLGTKIQQWPNKEWSTESHPVKHVAGGYYVLAIQDSPDAHLLSADQLGLDLSGKEKLIIRLQNHAPATEMRLKFITDAEPTWSDARSAAFAVVASDNASRTCSVDLSSVPAWKGRLRQLRLELASGKPLTDTCRIDYIWLCSPATGK